jgi:hypothetical protein
MAGRGTRKCGWWVGWVGRRGWGRVPAAMAKISFRHAHEGDFMKIYGVTDLREFFHDALNNPTEMRSNVPRQIIADSLSSTSPILNQCQVSVERSVHDQLSRPP